MRAAGRRSHPAARESDCCSFFAFTFTFTFAEDEDEDEEGLVLDVRVPAAHSSVLDGLAARAIESSPRAAS
ncbi:hypothetical protein Sme01_57210 [Sphaerisporangium melleum]|uniref:Uncharacterized protein n=1 Tax=Sphaerisporangium melleum TaxID=321316 RepID=A0A917R8A9_9ACTN|nr:hypothetical protein [Sphaerisporangium melleum]GGK94460.1 hypothetical protein GCM10007964_41090 [Sphaerisporangium melleum]GII73245.1 hypothetical protein Sme01_57210 [Sphaerisporangium melleum]